MNFILIHWFSYGEFYLNRIKYDFRVLYLYREDVEIPTCDNISKKKKKKKKKIFFFFIYFKKNLNY